MQTNTAETLGDEMQESGNCIMCGSMAQAVVQITTLSPGGFAQENLELEHESMILQGVSKSNTKSYEFLDMPETVLGKTSTGKEQNRH